MAELTSHASFPLIACLALKPEAQTVSHPQTGMPAPAPYAHTATPPEPGKMHYVSLLTVIRFSDGFAEIADTDFQIQQT